MTIKEAQYFKEYIDEQLNDRLEIRTKQELSTLLGQRFADRFMADIAGQQNLPQSVFRQFLEEIDYSEAKQLHDNLVEAQEDLEQAIEDADSVSDMTSLHYTNVAGSTQSFYIYIDGDTPELQGVDTSDETALWEAISTVLGEQKTNSMQIVELAVAHRKLRSCSYLYFSTRKTEGSISSTTEYLWTAEGYYRRRFVNGRLTSDWTWQDAGTGTGGTDGTDGTDTTAREAAAAAQAAATAAQATATTAQKTATTASETATAAQATASAAKATAAVASDKATQIENSISAINSNINSNTTSISKLTSEVGTLSNKADNTNYTLVLEVGDDQSGLQYTDKVFALGTPDYLVTLLKAYRKYCVKRDGTYYPISTENKKDYMTELLQMAGRNIYPIVNGTNMKYYVADNETQYNLHLRPWRILFFDRIVELSSAKEGIISPTLMLLFDTDTTDFFEKTNAASPISPIGVIANIDTNKWEYVDADYTVLASTDLG